MILLSKASASFTELGWSAQLFLVRDFCKFIRYLALPVFICPMLCMEKYHVYSNTTHKNKVLQKLLAKSEGKLKTGRGLKDLLSRVGCQCLRGYGARWVWQEECLIFTPLGSLVWQVARRCWSGNAFAYETICQAMKENGTLRVTLPHKVVDENILEQAVKH